MLGLDIQSILVLAVAGGLAGAVGWSVRTLPETVITFVRRVSTSTLDVRRGDLVVLLDRLIFEKAAGRRQQIDRMTPRGTRAPANGWHFFRYGGSWIGAHRELDEGGGDKGSSLADIMRMPRVTLWCLGGMAPINQLMAEADTLEQRDQEAQDRSSYFTIQWGDWERNSSHHTNGMSNVVLPEGVAERMIDAGKRFFDSEDWYKRTGANWTEGWLFVGPPGTGKSRTAWGMAQELNAKMHIPDLGRPGMTNAELNRMLRRMEPRSVLLLDDLDKTLDMLGKQGQKEGASQITLAGLLAALELPGAAGRLVIITANDAALLDPDGTGALTRPRRVDRTWHFDVTTPEQAGRMLEKFDGTMPPEDRERWIEKHTGRGSAEVYGELIERFHPMRTGADVN